MPAERGAAHPPPAGGRGATFGLGHVHDVVNIRAAHAVSVHAYSPPLTAMSYYAVDPGGATAADPLGAHGRRVGMTGG